MSPMKARGKPSPCGPFIKSTGNAGEPPFPLSLGATSDYELYSFNLVTWDDTVATSLICITATRRSVVRCMTTASIM